MARIVPLWRSGELSLHRFDHPPEHEDRPYESVAGAFTASFVDDGTFDLHVDADRRSRTRARRLCAATDPTQRS